MNYLKIDKFKFLLALLFIVVNNVNADVKIPKNIDKNFKWGFAICEYQNSGAKNCPNCNWTEWENFKFSNRNPAIKDNQKSEFSTNFWNQYKNDIIEMQKFGINSLRLSIAWDRIEPEEGKFDETAIKHYQNLCDSLIEAGIEPMITLHHFTHPIWFEKLGAFEKRGNIKYFVRFSKIIFEALSDKVSLWCTINEPTIYMLQGYLRGVFPPGKTNLKLGIRVLKNLLIAHTETYQELKKMPHGEKSQIGLVHQYLKFQPYTSWNLFEKIPSAWNHFNDLVLDFCKTGEFKYSIPLLSTYYKAPEGSKILDFIGLNYYSRALIKFDFKEFLKPSCYPTEIMTDMPYGIYSDGLYYAIKDVSKIGVPIYITENGIADNKDDRREQFLKEYVNRLFLAIKVGYNIKGYYYWTFADNFEWDEGYAMKFGLFEVDRVTQARNLKPGAKYYKEVIKTFNDNFKV